MVYHPSKYLGYFPVWIHWFDLRNELSLLCAALFCRDALTMHLFGWFRLHFRGWGCWGRGSSLQGQYLLPQGRSAFLLARLSLTEHKCPVGALVLGAWITHLFPSLAMKNLSGSPEKGPGIWQGMQTPAQLRRNPFLTRQFHLSKGLKLERNVWSNGGTPPSPQTTLWWVLGFLFLPPAGIFQIWICLVWSCHTLGVEGTSAQHFQRKQKQN